LLEEPTKKRSWEQKGLDFRLWSWIVVATNILIFQLQSESGGSALTEAEAYEVIRAALSKVAPSKASKLTEETDLIAAGILDSLDVMTFLFEIEQRLDKKLAAIDETYNDFRVQKLIEIIRSA